MQNLDEQLEKLTQLHPSAQDIFYFKKIMHYFIKTNNQDAILAISGNNSAEIKKYSDIYAEKFYSYSRLAIDSLIESNIKQAAHANNHLQEGFSSEPLTHAINAAVLCEKRQFKLGEHALDTAKKMALRDLNFSKKEWQDHSVKYSELYCNPSDADINFYTNNFQQSLKKAEEQYHNINKMEINFYEKAYHYSSSENEKSILWQKWHDSVSTYVSEHPLSELEFLDPL